GGVPQRQCDARYPEDLRRDIVVAAVESPNAARAILALAVRFSGKQPAREDVLESRSRRARELQIEIVERPTIGIARLSREAVFDGEVRDGLVSRQGLRQAVLDGRRPHHPELRARKDGWIAAGIDASEAIA